MRLSSLRAKIALFVTLIVAITLAVSGFMLHRIYARGVRHATQEHIDALAIATRHSIIEAMATQCIDIDNILESLSKHEDIIASRIFNVDGLIRHSTQPSELGQDVDPVALRLFREGRNQVLFDGGEGSNRTLCLVYPIENEPRCYRCHDADTKINGVLNLCASMDHVEGDLRRGSMILLSMTLITLLTLVLGITWMMGRIVTKPVQGLVGAMRKAEGGALSARARVGRNDELGLIASSFNSMVERLQETQEQVEELHREEMRRADRLAVTGQLAASLAHEIRNPLAGISGAVEVLARGLAEDDPKREITKEISRQIGRVDNALKNLLSFTRPTTPELKETDINEQLRRTLFFALQQKDVSETKVALDLQPGLPKTLVDRGQMEQVFLNIILNALQAMPGEGKLEVRTSMHGVGDDGRLIRAEICDSGEGIPPDVMERMFKPFYTTKVKGTGLGLAISKEIVEKHGGKISVRSDVGKGACFMIDVPVRTAKD